MTSRCNSRNSVPPLILASASPRRSDLLRQAGVKFKVAPSRYEEGLPSGCPREFARRAAEAKAGEVAGRIKQEAWVLAADTLVVQGGRIFGKPRSRPEAAGMLKVLSGRTHKVISGVALRLAPQGKKISWVQETSVRMREIPETELQAYLDSGEWQDKAGAYGIQGRAGAFVISLSGCYFNVVGLPLGAVCAELNKRGIGSWKKGRK